jgi:hypothetical protein
MVLPFCSCFVLFALILSLPRAALGILGFENEAVSCEVSSALASEVLALEVAGCDAYRAPCSASTQCDTCNWIEDDKATASCLDGCAYCDNLGNCVERSTVATHALGLLGDNYVVLQNAGVTWTFAQGEHTGAQFVFVWEPGLLGFCSASWNGENCQCGQYNCDDTQTEYGYTADCTAIAGGTVLNTCLPNAGLIWEEGFSVMDMLVQFPSQMCKLFDEENSAETTNTIPPTTRTDGGSGTTTGEDSTTTEEDSSTTDGTTAEEGSKPATGVTPTTGGAPTMEDVSSTPDEVASNGAASFKWPTILYVWTASIWSCPFFHA